MEQDKPKRGFATLSKEQLRAVSRKGGSRKALKGFALLTEEERKINARKGAQAAHEKRKQLRKRQNEQNSISSGDGSTSP